MQSIESFHWTDPNYAVNQREIMRARALHIVARKHCNYEGMWKIAQASFEPWSEGEWEETEA